VNAGTLLAQAQSPFGALGAFLPFILILVVFYLLLILPQQRRQKQHRAMLAALKAGDKVVTSGGVFGTVAGIDEQTVILRVADQVKIKVLRSAIAQVEREGEAK
jgi:preprotein translocase subunit YajC